MHRLSPPRTPMVCSVRIYTHVARGCTRTSPAWASTAPSWRTSAPSLCTRRSCAWTPTCTFGRLWRWCLRETKWCVRTAVVDGVRQKDVRINAVAIINARKNPENFIYFLIKHIFNTKQNNIFITAKTLYTAKNSVRQRKRVTYSTDFLIRVVVFFVPSGHFKKNKTNTAKLFFHEHTSPPHTARNRSCKIVHPISRLCLIEKKKSGHNVQNRSANTRRIK